MGLFSSSKIIPKENNNRPIRKEEIERAKIQLGDENAKLDKLVALEKKLEELEQELIKYRPNSNQSKSIFTECYVSETATKQAEKFDIVESDIEHIRVEVCAAIKDTTFGIKNTKNNINQLNTKIKNYNILLGG